MQFNSRIPVVLCSSETIAHNSKGHKVAPNPRLDPLSTPESVEKRQHNQHVNAGIPALRANRNSLISPYVLIGEVRHRRPSPRTAPSGMPHSTPPCLHGFFSEGALLLSDPAGRPLAQHHRTCTTEHPRAIENVHFLVHQLHLFTRWGDLFGDSSALLTLDVPIEHV